MRTGRRLDHLRQEFELDFGGNRIRSIHVLAGATGWRKFGDNQTDLDENAVANLRRHAYLAMIQITPLPLKGSRFKVETIREE